MEIYFTDKKLQKICQSSKLLKQKFGQLAIKIQARLADLDAASNVTELTAGRPHPLLYSRQGQYAVDLTNMIRLIFEPANDPTPKNPDGTVDWKMVTMVRIVEIEDYHE